MLGWAGLGWAGLGWLGWAPPPAVSQKLCPSLPLASPPVGMLNVAANPGHLYFGHIFIYLCIIGTAAPPPTDAQLQPGLAIALLILGINFISTLARTISLLTTNAPLHLRSFKKQSRKPYFVCCVGREDTFIYHNNKDNSIKTPIIARYNRGNIYLS